MSLIPKIQRLYFHARNNSGGSYKPHALRMDSLTYMMLRQDRDFTRMVMDPAEPATANKFMGMKIIVEEFNDGSKKHHLTVEMKQKGEDGRYMYFEYADLMDDAHYARPDGTQSEPLTIGGAEPPAKTAE